MKTHVLPCLLLVIAFSSCVPASRQKGSTSKRWDSFGTLPAVTSSISDVDTTLLVQPDVPAGSTPASLMELPRTEEGGFVLAPGLYEADFKTYCLQPGTPDPSPKDLYFQASLEGSRKDVIESILLNSRQQSHLAQKNVQLLLWSVVSRSDFHKLSPDVKSAAFQLLSPKQLFELQGGVVGVVKTVAQAIPASGNQNDIRRLLDMGISSYEAIERLAVINSPSVPRITQLRPEQWKQHSEGYYVRYLANNYRQTRIQVYIPQSMAEATAYDQGNYVVFDPTSWVVVPANSNAQRLGIGGPMINIIRAVIKVSKSRKVVERPKEPKQPKPVPKGS